MWKHFAALALLLTSACSDGDRDAVPSWWREAGSVIDNGHFGEATLNNTSIHNGDKQYVLALANRFSEEVNSTVNFAFDSTQLDHAARMTLQQQASWILQFPEVRFKVYGHTDLVGSDAYNRSLGLRRAKTVVSYLVARGVNRDRLEAVVSLGKEQPLVVTQGRERRNRRTVTEVTGFVDRHPTVLDGKYAEVVYRQYVTGAKPQTELVGLSATGTSSE